MNSNKILIVEDDKNIAKLVKYNLEKNNCNCIVTTTGEEALNVLETKGADLIILDVMLPGIDGIEVLKRIRQKEKLSLVPVIMLTAKGEEIDKVLGFELGADDYLVKPFSVRELMLRIKAILKRSKAKVTEKDEFETGNLKIDVERNKVTVDDKKVELTPMEFKLLIKLMRAQGIVLSREKLLDDLWDISADITTRTVDTHIKRLRNKLGAYGALIETVHGIGYKFKENE